MTANQAGLWPVATRDLALLDQEHLGDILHELLPASEIVAGLGWTALEEAKKRDWPRAYAPGGGASGGKRDCYVSRSLPRQ